MNVQQAIASAVANFERGDSGRAIEALSDLVRRAPGSAAAHNALGSVLAAVGEWSQAAAAFRAALELNPDSAHAHTNLGNLQLEAGQIVAARELLTRAVTLPGVPVQAYVGLGRAHLMLGAHRAAADAFERATASSDRPNIHSQRCYASLLDPTASREDVLAIHERYDVAITAPLRQRAVAPARLDRSGRRRTVGYVSADFREHSVASFIEGVLSAHDRERFEVVLYSDVRHPDATTERLAASVDRYASVAGLSDAAVAAQIRGEQVDVLIDLAGHMQPNRLPMFARRPAPVLLTYLGYPGTTGVSVFDGRITDAWADPEEAGAVAGPEPLLRVEGGYFAYAPPVDAPEVGPLPAAASGVFTFGSFNDVLKVNDTVLSTWAQLLEDVPHSRLLLKSRGASLDMRTRIEGVLADGGADPQRIEFLDPTATRRAHLELYGRVDLALDTFPYAGATTTCEALYMGVPVVTLAGDRHAGRLGVSLLSAAGLSEFIASTRDDYLEIATRWSTRGIDTLAALRLGMRARVRASPLSSGERVARAIEHWAEELARPPLPSPPGRASR